MYLFEREKARASTSRGGGAEGEGEANSPLSEEPDVGLSLNPGIMTWAKDRCLTN